jgi:hypothetical protein
VLAAGKPHAVRFFSGRSPSPSPATRERVACAASGAREIVGRTSHIEMRNVHPGGPDVAGVWVPKVHEACRRRIPVQSCRAGSLSPGLKAQDKSAQGNALASDDARESFSQAPTERHFVTRGLRTRDARGARHTWARDSTRRTHSTNDIDLLIESRHQQPRVNQRIRPLGKYFIFSKVTLESEPVFLR